MRQYICGGKCVIDDASVKLGFANLLQGPPAVATQLLRKALMVVLSMNLCDTAKPIAIPLQSNMLTCMANGATSIGFGILRNGQQGRKWFKDSVLGY